MPKTDHLALFSDEQLGKKPLLAEESLRNAAANEIWKRREVDELLDLYFSGTDPGRIAVTLKRNRKAIIRKLQEYIYNERNRAQDYKPRLRQSRKGKRLTQNEMQVIAECRKKGVAWEQIALVIQRDVDEICMGEADTAKAESRQLRQVAPGVDLLLAYRFLYYVKHAKAIPDKAYDDLKQEEVEYGCGGKTLREFAGMKRAEDYPPHIRALARYLIFKHDH